MKNTKPAGAPARNYLGTPPTDCDICHRPLDGEFVDGATRLGPWANTCTSCFLRYGKGFGTGRGQQYIKQPNNQWLKTK